MFGSRFGNNASSSAAGFEFGNALDFDGINDNVTANDVSIAGASTTAVTVSLWMKPDSITSGTNQIVFSTANSNTETFGLQKRDGSGTGYMRMFVRDGSSNYVEFQSALSSTNWQHVFIVYDGSQATSDNRVKMWVDSTEITAKTSSVADQPTSISSACLSNFTTGVWASTVSFTKVYYGGILDEFAIWTDYVGNGTEAASLYNSGNGALATDVIASPERYYRLNESGSTATAADDSGNSNTGTLNNFTLPGAWVAH